MPLSPYQMVTIAAGTMAMARVISRRAQGGSRMSMKPSITIWPESVAVTVELSPQHNSAMPNNVGAMAEPSSGARNECTCSSSATSVLPILLKVAAARMRIEALISSANISAMVELMVASLIASRLSVDAVAEAPRLHDAGMQIEIVRHHGGAENAEREIKHVRIGHDLRRSAQSRGSRRPSPDRPSRSGWRNRP